MATGKNHDVYVEEVYKFLRQDSVGLEAVYEDYIIQLIGRYGLNALIEARYLETCGVVNGRQLYTLCCEGES